MTPTSGIEFLVWLLIAAAIRSECDKRVGATLVYKTAAAMNRQFDSVSGRRHGDQVHDRVRF